MVEVGLNCTIFQCFKSLDISCLFECTSNSLESKRVCHVIDRLVKTVESLQWNHGQLQFKSKVLTSNLLRCGLPDL